MKNFADIKRALCEGVTVTMIKHDWYPASEMIGKQRKIVKRQSNAIQFEGGSWLFFDKPASHFKANSANEFSVLLNPNDNEPKYMAYLIS